MVKNLSKLNEIKNLALELKRELRRQAKFYGTNSLQYQSIRNEKLTKFALDVLYILKDERLKK